MGYDDGGDGVSGDVLWLMMMVVVVVVYASPPSIKFDHGSTSWLSCLFYYCRIACGCRDRCGRNNLCAK